MKQERYVCALEPDLTHWEALTMGRQITAARILIGATLEEFASLACIKVEELSAIEEAETIEAQVFLIDGIKRRFPGPLVFQIAEAIADNGVDIYCDEEGRISFEQRFVI